MQVARTAAHALWVIYHARTCTRNARAELNRLDAHARALGIHASILDLERRQFWDHCRDPQSRLARAERLIEDLSRV